MSSIRGLPCCTGLPLVLPMSMREPAVRQRTPGDSGGLDPRGGQERVRAADIGRLCSERGWSRDRLVRELRGAARRLKPQLELPADDSLKRMIRQWINSDRDLSPLYAELLTLVFGLPFETGRDPEPDDGALALAERLSRTASALDAELVLLLEQQTDSYRTLDRRLGARRVLTQNEAHIQHMSALLAFALGGPERTALAEAVAEAAALAGWQALDLGRPDQAWVWHETARAAALDSGNPAVIAHVTAQQAFALLDLGRVDAAVAQLDHVRRQARGRVPRMLEAWLCASTAEALAAGGQDGGARTALDKALVHMTCGDGEQLAYVFLNDVHLGRWRGHCLARLGASDAVDELESALAVLDPTFARAQSALLVDLALAHSRRGDRDAAREHAQRALGLAEATSSARQRKRIERLLAASDGRAVA